MPRESAQFGMPGDKEHVVKLMADHSSVCKFGQSQSDQDNFKLVWSNIRDLYKNALKKALENGELCVLPPIIDQGGRAHLAEEDILDARLARLPRLG